MGAKGYKPEKDIKGSSEPIPINTLKIIEEQSEKSICKINCNDGGTRTGFFCKIPYPDKLHQLQVLMTNAHVIKEEDNEIKFSLKEKDYEIKIKDSRKIYINEEYDITIIEIKEKDIIDNNLYLELDDNIFKLDEIYKEKSVYLLSYPYGGTLNYSYGKIKLIDEDKYTIRHSCNSNPGSSGGPIMNLNNQRVLGIHKGANIDKNLKLGTLIKEPIEIFNGEKKEEDEIIIIYEYKENKNITNDIINEVKKELGETLSENKIFGEHFVETNKNICKMIIDGKESEICSYLNEIKNGEIEIKLKRINNLKDISYMICGCISLKCVKNIENLNLKNINDLSFLFTFCCNLVELPDISKWETSNVTKLNAIFYQCASLKSLPDISKWNINNITDMGSIFYQCSSLTLLPDISNWNIDNVTDMG